MNLRPRGRQKGPVAPAAAHSSRSTAPTLGALSSDAIRESLSLLKDSADAFPPLKSAVGGVLAVWDLAERVSASDENAQALAHRVTGILDTISKSVGKTGSVSPEMQREIDKFNALLDEISAAMKGHLKAGRLRRVLHLRRQESRLAQFTARLDAAAEAFKIGSSARTELASARIESTSTRVELALEKIQANVSSTVTLAISLEQSNIRLRGEVKVLRQTQTVFLFGLPLVSHGFTEGGCACTLAHPLSV
ncbi:hypothetical protein B0H17DRAFT_1066122 [Mycena rosella]|uniref:Uncharacterized protein n=1 Tax=Mycena rosella TaxID=1033263 RepID=A0AAD7GGD3_MYCRO|nr:hypothetical protein B0H17DRAFT_1066122 [Mycena rosella]